MCKFQSYLNTFMTAYLYTFECVRSEFNLNLDLCSIHKGKCQSCPEEVLPLFHSGIFHGVYVLLTSMLYWF